MARRLVKANYLEPREFDELQAHAPNDSARMLLLLQWRAGLRISEAVSVRLDDVHLSRTRPTLTVHRPLPDNDRRHLVKQWRGQEPRDFLLNPMILAARARGETTYARVVPLHPELADTLRSWKGASDGRILRAQSSTANRWMRSAVAEARRRRKLAKYGRPLSSRTLRNGHIVHMIVNGIPLETLREWLGLAQYYPMSQYVEMLPDPEAVSDRTGMEPEDILAAIP